MKSLAITVIFDGQCELCRNSISWVKKRVEINALDFHTTELSQFGLSIEQCSREVFVIADHVHYSGAHAVAFLLKYRGNAFLSRIISASGKLGEYGYHWIATHRNSPPIKALAVLLKRAAS